MKFDEGLARRPGLSLNSFSIGSNGGELGGAKKLILDLWIRFCDFDLQGHLNNAVYFMFFEQGRVEFVNQVFRSVDLTNIDIVVGHVRCDFLVPIRLKDEVKLHLWVSNIGRKSFEFRYHVVSRADSDLIYAKGLSVQVFYDNKKGCSVIIPDDYREKLQDYRTDS